MPIYSLAGRRVELRGEHHFIAPDAMLVGDIVLENNVNIWFKVVIRGDNDSIFIGESTNIQEAAVLHVDPGFPIRLGRNVTVGHKAMLHGCTVGDGALIGINSVVLNGATIGPGSLVGANSLIPEGTEFPGGVLILGSPAKIVRALKPEEQQHTLGIASRYVEKSRRYKTEMREQPPPASAR